MPPPPTLEDLEDKYFPAGTNAGVPHLKDTKVIPRVDGEEFFRAIADALDQCTTGPGDQIYITSWLLDPRILLRVGGSKTLGELLLEKAILGADVRIIVWTGRFYLGREGTPADLKWWLGLGIGSYKGTAGFTQVVMENFIAALKLRSAKVPPAVVAPLEGRVLMDWGCSDGGSRHDKSTIIYSTSTKELRAFLGGIDYEGTRMDNELHTMLPVGPMGWHDAGVELQGGAAAAVLGNFRTRWEETSTLPKRLFNIEGVIAEFNPKIEPTKPSQPAAPNPVVSGSGVRVVRSYGDARSLALWDEKNDLPWASLPAGGVQELKRVLQRATDAATNYIYVEDQGLNRESSSLPLPVMIPTAPHTLLYPMISSACARGVKVIFVCPGQTDPTDHTVALTTMSDEILDEILDPLTPAQRGNFALYLVSNTVVHSKVVLVDDEFASIGSGNFWDRSMTGLDSEINAAITDPGPLVADLRSRLWRDHLRVSSSPLVEAELHDLTKSLGFFRAAWGSGITFAHPNSALVEIKPP